MSAPVRAQQARHPLDALTSAEYWAVQQAIQASGRADSTTVFTSTVLRPLAKKEVLGWKPGAPFRREAFVVLRHQKQTVEAVVDVRARKVLSWTPRPEHEAMWGEGDFGMTEELIKKDPRVRAALSRRGVTDLRTVSCFAIPLGYFGESGPRRVGRGGCALATGAFNTNNARVFEGLTVAVDLNAGTVLEVTDEGSGSMPSDGADFTREALATPRAAAKPLVVTQPLGEGYALDGSELSWQRWKLHVRLDQRVGLVLSRVRWAAEDGVERSVLYEGSLSEIFVPYMDPSKGWYNRVFLDAGEYSRTGLAHPMEPGTDCPEYATYLDAYVASAQGAPRLRPNVGCIFERATGDVAWRHGEYAGRIESRPSRELVVRMAAVIGNYDYVFDWILKQDGGIKVVVGATGIIEAKPVAARMIASAAAGSTPAAADEAVDRYGHLVAENVLGVHHDHFFNFRLDLDVDGTDNSLLVDQIVPKRLPEGSVRKSLWVVEPRVARTEGEAKLHQQMDRPALWRVINPAVHGPVGYPTSYQISAGHSAMSLLDKDDWPQIRAGFSDHELWVTPWRNEERFAAGDYPTLSRGPEGLPTWTKADRPIAGTDIVAWLTVGFHHVPRAEDWPVMPTAEHSFELRPFDFFARNPALGLPLKP